MRIDVLTQANKYQSPSFSAMKKSQFQGIEKFVIEQTKAPIEQFNTSADFYKYCTEIINKLTKKNFDGRNIETGTHRKSLLNEWFNYVTKENDAYTSPIQLMILSSVTKALKQDNDTLPPILNKGVLADTVTKIHDELQKDDKIKFNFDKEYRINLQQSILKKDERIDGNLNGWIIIPSKKHDPENFEKNVQKLKTLSHHSWCTKSFNAENYLKRGDFRIYMENSKPELGVRFIDDTVEEIQGPNNDGKIPFNRLEQIDCLKKLKLSDYARKEILTLAKKNLLVKICYPKGVENYSTKQILRRCGIRFKQDKDGLLILSEYRYPFKDIPFKDIGVDEDKMFRDIKEIKGNADFYGKYMTLGNLERIGGTANFAMTDIKDWGKLKYVDNIECMSNSYISNEKRLELKDRMAKFVLETYFPNGIENYSTEEIFKTFNIECKKDTDGLLIISRYEQPYNGFITFSDLGINEDKLLNDVKIIEGIADFYFSKSNATNLGNVKEIHGNVLLGPEIQNIESLNYIGKTIQYSDSKVGKEDCKRLLIRMVNYIKEKYFPNGIENYTTQEIMEAFGFECKADKNGKLTISQYTQPFSKLKFSYFGIDENKLLDDIRCIKGDANFNNSEALSTGNVEEIGGNLNLTDSKISSLPKLKKIGRDLYMNYNKLLTSLFPLEYIGGNLDMNYTNVNSLGHLKRIKGRVSANFVKFDKSEFNNVRIDGDIKHLRNYS